MRKLFAEFFGTYWLVFGGCGSALFAAGISNLGIGFAGVALAFGLTVLTMAYAVGHISGGHFNPAVSFGLWAGGRFSAKDLLSYIVAQCLERLPQPERFSLFGQEKKGMLLTIHKPELLQVTVMVRFRPKDIL